MTSKKGGKRMRLCGVVLLSPYTKSDNAAGTKPEPAVTGGQLPSVHIDRPVVQAPFHGQSARCMSKDVLNA